MAAAISPELTVRANSLLRRLSADIENLRAMLDW
jgi:hypothetical protein